MATLPPDAGQDSRVRHDLARPLTAGCPPALGEGIALTGSVARGVADRFSDIELTFWVRDLPPIADFQAWLDAAGARAEPPEDEDFPPGSFWTKSWFEGVFVETIWQTWAALDDALGEVLAARTSDHWALTWAWHVAHAVPVRACPPWISGRRGSPTTPTRSRAASSVARRWPGLTRTGTPSRP